MTKKFKYKDGDLVVHSFGDLEIVVGEDQVPVRGILLTFPMEVPDIPLRVIFNETPLRLTVREEHTKTNDDLPVTGFFADEITEWEVRSPIVYGSRSEGKFSSEKEARAFAKNYFENDHIQIHTKSRIIYIESEDE